MAGGSDVLLLFPSADISTVRQPWRPNWASSIAGTLGHNAAYGHFSDKWLPTSSVTSQK